MSLIQIISSYILGIIFIFAGIDKLLHYNMFLNALANYVIMPLVLIPYFALTLILSEIWIGIGLLIKKYRKNSSILSFFLLFVFTIALIINFIYKPGAICGCWFTITLGTVDTLHIIQNIIMISISLIIWLHESYYNINVQ